METEVAALPDDALANVLRRLPARSLAKARRVCKAWRAVVDARALLLPPHRGLLPHHVHGVFINYIDHRRPHLFARPASSGEIDSILRFLPIDHSRAWWSVLDHCRGLLLFDMRDNELCVCSPATRRWTLLPRRPGVATSHVYAGAYLAFDPAVSPHYEVYLIPNVPEAPPSSAARGPTLEELLDIDYWPSSPPDNMAIAEETEEEVKQLPSTDEDDELVGDDPCRSMEWPPTPWTLSVFSSRTDQWEGRVFVSEGESPSAAATIQHVRLDRHEPTWRGPRQRYAVYWQGALYMHCRGHFITRLSLSDNKYQVIKTPEDIKKDTSATPYLGISKKGVYFGIVQGCRLRVWTLSESSCGQAEWILKSETDLTRSTQHIAEYGRQMDAPWIVHDIDDDDSCAEALREERVEWDSDNDDFFTTEEAGQAEEFCGADFDIVGFHPYKEVVFLAKGFSVVAYHLNTSRIQYLGNSRPRSCYRNYTNDIFESFVYTPCMIGELNERREY